MPALRDRSNDVHRHAPNFNPKARDEVLASSDVTEHLSSKSCITSTPSSESLLDTVLRATQASLAFGSQAPFKPHPLLCKALHVLERFYEGCPCMSDFGPASSVPALVDLVAQRVPWIPPRSSCPAARLPFEILSQIMLISAADAATWDANNEKPLDALEAIIIVCRCLRQDIIFRRAHPDAMDVEPPSPRPSADITPKRAFPVALSHVCQYWRDVATGTGGLWTDIPIHIDAATKYIRRSRTSPLAIRFALTLSPYQFCFDPSTNSSNKCRWQTERMRKLQLLRAFITVVTPHRARWRDFCAQTNSPNAMFEVIKAFDTAWTNAPANFPSLERLCLLLTPLSEWESWTTEMLRDHAGIVFGEINAPRLAYLAVGGGFYGLMRTPAIVNLTQLEIGYTAGFQPTWSDISALMAGSPCLQSLALSDVRPLGQPTPYVRRAYELNALTSLVLHKMCPAIMLRFIRNLRFPSLLALTLGCKDACGITDGSSLLQHLIDRPLSTLANLQEFGLVNFMCADHVASAAFTQLNSLTILHIVSTLPSAPVWNPTKYLLLAGACPKLQVLGWHPADEFATRMLLSVRHQYGHRLQVLKVGIDLKEGTRQSIGLKEQVERVVFWEGGMSVYITDPTCRLP